MTYLRHLEACNAFDPARFLPLVFRDRRIGFVRADRIAVLESVPELFSSRLDALVLHDHGGREAMNAALAKAIEAVTGRDATAQKRGEAFAIRADWGGEVLFDLDRGLVPYFGTRSFGVHLNGWVAGSEAATLWIGKRAADKKVAPGKLDNLVAGGIGWGHGARETLIKEAGEEADIGPDLAARARPVGAIRYRMEVPEGLRDDTLFVYDLELPEGFEPRNTDGEIEDFRLMSAADCLRLVRETDEFKFNVNLVLTDFGLRHGLIAPDDADYLDLVDGLRGGLVKGPR